MSAPESPPAFPTTKPLDSWGDPNQGMTLRDWFAGQAVSGNVSPGCVPEQLAEWSYLIADAMLATRTKSKS